MRQDDILNTISTSFFIFAPKSVMLVLTAFLLTYRAKRIVQLSKGDDF